MFLMEDEEMKRIDALYRDNLLVEIIYQHKGKGNAIGTKDIVRCMSENGYKLPADQVHSVVKKITAERHLPICSVNHVGYWWGTSKQDFIDAIADLQAKIDGLNDRIDLLKSFIYD